MEQIVLFLLWSFLSYVKVTAAVAVFQLDSLALVFVGFI